MSSNDAQGPLAQGITGQLADVALIDARTCAAAGDVSVSWWHEAVREGLAPQPAIRAPRMTRWRLVQVRNFWATFCAHADSQVAERLATQATKASAAAKRKRLTGGAQ